jgi:hypothetical protein
MVHEINLHPRHAKFTRNFAGGPVAHCVQIENLQVLGLHLRPTRASAVSTMFRFHSISHSASRLSGPGKRSTVEVLVAVASERDADAAAGTAAAELVSDSPPREVEQPALERAALRVGLRTRGSS